MSLISQLGQLTANVTLEKYAVSPIVAGGIHGAYKGLTNPNPTNNRPGSFFNPGGVRPGARGASLGTPQQRQQAMNNPKTRAAYIQQAKQQEQQNMAGKGINNTLGSPTAAGMRAGFAQTVDPTGHGRQAMSYVKNKIQPAGGGLPHTPKAVQ